jgi:hypothetical protein
MEVASAATRRGRATLFNAMTRCRARIGSVGLSHGRAAAGGEVVSGAAGRPRGGAAARRDGRAAGRPCGGTAARRDDRAVARPRSGTVWKQNNG